MSTLWTPSGEHPVPRAGGDSGNTGGSGASGSRSGGSGGSGRQPGGGDEQGSGSAGGPLREPTSHEIHEAEAEMEAVREELLSAPVEAVIANHALGLWQLAALHLSGEPPQLAQAQLAIDALAALLDGLHGRLGEDERTLTEGLTQMRMAFVQIANAERTREGAG